MSSDPDDTRGAYSTVFAALTRGTMTFAQAEEWRATSERLHGADDGQTIGYARAISRASAVRMSDGGEI